VSHLVGGAAPLSFLLSRLICVLHFKRPNDSASITKDLWAKWDLSRRFPLLVYEAKEV